MGIGGQSAGWSDKMSHLQKFQIQFWICLSLVQEVLGEHSFEIGNTIAFCITRCSFRKSGAKRTRQRLEMFSQVVPYSHLKSEAVAIFQELFRS
jgi:hypothetical protein